MKAGIWEGGRVDFCSQSVSLAIVYLSVLELPGVWTRKRQDKNRPRICCTVCSAADFFVCGDKSK